MSVEKYHLEWIGSLNMQEDDVATPQGGGPDPTVGVAFRDLVSGKDTVKICSDSASDTTQTITVHGRLESGAKTSIGDTLNGTTPVSLGATELARMMKVLKGATCVGHVAAYYDTAVHTGAATGGSTTTINLDAGASGTERAYLCMMIKITSGNASGDIRRICHYDHTNKIAIPHAPFSGAVASSDTFEIYRGVVFRNETGTNETEQTKIVRPWYDAIANEDTGDKDVKEKAFVKNCHPGGADSTLTNGVVKEISDPTSRVTFALETSMGGTDVTGGDNTRLGTLSGYTLDNNDKDMSESGNLDAGDAQGTWLNLNLVAGASPENSEWIPEVEGSTT